MGKDKDNANQYGQLPPRKQPQNIQSDATPKKMNQDPTKRPLPPTPKQNDQYGALPKFRDEIPEAERKPEIQISRAADSIYQPFPSGAASKRNAIKPKLKRTEKSKNLVDQVKQSKGGTGPSLG